MVNEMRDNEQDMNKEESTPQRDWLFETYKILGGGIFTVLAVVLAVDGLQDGLAEAQVRTDLTPTVQIDRENVDPFDDMVDSTPRFRITNLSRYHVTCLAGCLIGDKIDCKENRYNKIGYKSSVVAEFEFLKSSAVSQLKACDKPTTRNFYFRCITSPELVSPLLEELKGYALYPQPAADILFNELATRDKKTGEDTPLLQELSKLGTNLDLEFLYRGSVRPPGWKPGLCDKKSA